MDYGIPRADDLPDFAFEPWVTASPNNPLDIKGCGEAGAGVEGFDIDMPVTPERVWRALHNARPAGDAPSGRI